jgi:hypothetical protein
LVEGETTATESHGEDDKAGAYTRTLFEDTHYNKVTCSV